MGPEPLMALLGVVAVVGGFVLGRFGKGRKLAGFWLAWMIAPFVVMVVLVAQDHPSSSYGPPALLYGILSAIIALPWFAGNLVGGIAGFLFRRNRTRTGGRVNGA